MHVESYSGQDIISGDSIQVWLLIGVAFGNEGKGFTLYHLNNAVADDNIRFVPGRIKGNDITGLYSIWINWAHPGQRAYRHLRGHTAAVDHRQTGGKYGWQHHQNSRQQNQQNQSDILEPVNQIPHTILVITNILIVLVTFNKNGYLYTMIPTNQYSHFIFPVSIPFIHSSLQLLKMEGHAHIGLVALVLILVNTRENIKGDSHLKPSENIVRNRQPGNTV